MIKQKQVTIGKNGRIYPLGEKSPHYKPELPHHKNIMVKCACGCGEKIKKYPEQCSTVINRFKKGHQANLTGERHWCYNPKLRKHDETLILCACGCGEKIRKFDKFGTRHKWKPGHHIEWLHNRLRGVPQGIKTPDNKLKSHSERERRAQYYYFNRDGGKNQCFVNKKICHNKLLMVWKDGDQTNFKKDNLLRLCHLHKEIFIKRNLTLVELKQVTAPDYEQFKYEQKMAYYWKNLKYYHQKGKEERKKKAEYWLEKGGYVLCSCGCGQSMPKYKTNGKERKFLPSHHLRRNWGDGDKTHSQSNDGIMKKDARPQYAIEGAW